MPFPRLKQNPAIQAEYARLNSASLADEVQGRVNQLASFYEVPDVRPYKAAAVIYLGLCRLRVFSEHRKQQDGRGICNEINDRYGPETGGKESVNTSFVVSDGNKSVTDHLKAINAACGIYLPRVKSRKKRCFVLLALGSEWNTETSLPPDDSWLANFNF